MITFACPHVSVPHRFGERFWVLYLSYAAQVTPVQFVDSQLPIWAWRWRWWWHLPSHHWLVLGGPVSRTMFLGRWWGSLSFLGHGLNQLLTTWGGARTGSRERWGGRACWWLHEDFVLFHGMLQRCCWGGGGVCVALQKGSWAAAFAPPCAAPGAFFLRVLFYLMSVSPYTSVMVARFPVCKIQYSKSFPSNYQVS